MEMVKIVTEVMLFSSNTNIGEGVNTLHVYNSSFGQS